jgi:hypothetical protein
MCFDSEHDKGQTVGLIRLRTLWASSLLRAGTSHAMPKTKNASGPAVPDAVSLLHMVDPDFRAR